MSETGERALAAIMFTDIAGYTSLTERDEPLAIRVRDRHRRLVETLVEQFHGERVDAVGDESLSIFPSAVEAVDCALAIQASLRQDAELQLRIGIHLGDVVRRGQEVMGEGVNLAARIRPLADPGGICISETVQQMVRTRSHIRTRALGQRGLKNVEQPVKVFSVLTGDAPVDRRSPARRAAIAFAGVVVTSLLLYAAYVPNRVAVLSTIALAAPLVLGDPVEQRLGFATTSDGVRIAYATTGEGPPLVFVLGWATHLERGLTSPVYDRSEFIRSNSERRMLVRYDGRGFGLSDRDVDEFTLEARLRDLEAVVEDLGLERFSIYAVSAGGPVGIAYTVAHPERVEALILAGTMAGASDLTTFDEERWRGVIDLFRTSWDSPIIRSMMVEFLEPNANEVQRSIMSEFLEVSGDGPAIAGFFEQMLFEIDTRDLMSRVSVPTLVIHGQEDQTIPLAAGRELASSIRGAQFEILAGANHGEGTIMSPRIPALIDEFLSAAAPSRM